MLHACVCAKENAPETSGCGGGSETPENECMLSVGQTALKVAWSMGLEQAKLRACGGRGDVAGPGPECLPARGRSRVTAQLGVGHAPAVAHDLSTGHRISHLLFSGLGLMVTWS